MGISYGEPVIVKNALGQEVAYQITYDGNLLLVDAVRPCGQAVYTISAGKPQDMKTFVTGKMYPERVDDIAWENDRTAYRLYGPALQRTEERAYGIDVGEEHPRPRGRQPLQGGTRQSCQDPATAQGGQKGGGTTGGDSHDLPFRPWLRPRLLQGGSHLGLRRPCPHG